MRCPAISGQLPPAVPCPDRASPEVVSSAQAAEASALQLPARHRAVTESAQASAGWHPCRHTGSEPWQQKRCYACLAGRHLHAPTTSKTSCAGAQLALNAPFARGSRPCLRDWLGAGGLSAVPPIPSSHCSSSRWLWLQTPSVIPCSVRGDRPASQPPGVSATRPATRNRPPPAQRLTGGPTLT